jgi:hypothetical protein
MTYQREGSGLEPADEGFILLARKLASRDGWPVQLRAEHFKFMVLLLLRARWRDCDFLAPDGTVIKIKRGQYASSVRRMAAEFRLSYKNCRTAIGILEQLGFLAQYVSHGVTVLTVRNYEHYQDIQSYVGASTGALSAQDGRKAGALKNEGNESNEGNEEAYKRVFNGWNSHPKIFPKHRRLTASMRRAVAARLRDFTAEQLAAAVRNYGDSDEPFWREWREVKRGWSLEQFLSRGEGAKVDKFLAGPLRGRDAGGSYSGAVNPNGRKFMK